MQKMKSKKGFTLIEMLVAVSIPMVNSSLERARVATDMANERSAKAAALVIYLGGDLTSNGGAVSGEATSAQITGGACKYDAANGKIVGSGTVTGYGQCAQHKGGYITVQVNDKTGVVTINWAGLSGSGTSTKAHLDPTTT